MRFDDGTQRQQSSITEVEKELQEQEQVVRDALAVYMQRRIQSQVERYVKQVGSDHTAAIGLDGVRRLKSEMMATVDAVPSRVQSDFGRIDRLYDSPPDVSATYRRVGGRSGLKPFSNRYGL
jgi:hypothetical protein